MTQQTEAQTLARDLEESFDGATASNAAKELRRLDARVRELESEVNAAKSAVSGLQKRRNDWKWRAKEAEAQLEAKQAVQWPEPVAHLVERHAFRASPDGQDAEGNSWLEECEAGEPGAFTVYTEQQVRAMLQSAQIPST